MNAIVITWQQLLFVGLGLVLFYVAELLFFMRRGAKHKVPADWQRQMYSLNDEISALRHEIDVLKVRLAASERVAQGEVVVATSEVETPYAHAIRMAQSGASVDQLVSDCGITRGEADLILALYRTARRS
ncbi:DUF2802 domain-containing protein [Chitinibacteraceae bacterium HSL-7]